MLSRVADSLYWISRYVERAENISRLLDVNLQLLLDFEGLDDEHLSDQWEPVVHSAGDTDLFRKHFDRADARSVTEFMGFSEENTNSILSCIRGARENARMVRDQISGEMWEIINELYHYVSGQSTEAIWNNGPSDFLAQIREGSLLFQGQTEATYMHEQGYKFLQVGKYLERADQTSRMIDMKYFMLLPEGEEVGGAIDTTQWMAVLRSCSALEAYHHAYKSEIQPWFVSEFLLLSPTFPRSLRFSVGALDYHLRSISKTAPGQFSNVVEQRCGRLKSEMTYTTIDEILDTGLHEYVDRQQGQLIDVHGALYETYIQPREGDFTLEAQIAEQMQQQQ